MAGHISTWMRRRPLLAFYVLAFAVTWLGWVPQALHSHGLFAFDIPILYLFGAGPMVAAFVVLRVLRGKEGDEELFGGLLRWRVGVGWYVVASFGYVAIWLAATSISGDLRTEIEELGPVFALIPVFLTYLLAAVPEEVAWRGFALPRLQASHSALISSLTIGILAALWHLPLLLTEGSGMSTYPLVPYFLYVVALTILYTWLFNSTAGSVLIVTIFHAASNTFGSFDLAEATVVLLLAAVLVIAFGPTHLSWRGERVVRNDRRRAVAPAGSEPAVGASRARGGDRQ